MKKYTILLLLVASFSVSHAQLFTIKGHEIGFAYLGPKVGTTFSTISNMDAVGTTTKSRTGFQIGAVGEIGLTEMLSFETELTFISKGVATDFNSTRVNYLSIPLLAKLSFNALGLSRIYAMGGTYNNLRTNARLVFDEFNEPITEHYSVIDWGLSLGAGAAYDTEYGLLCLDVRYDLGVIDVDNVTDQRNSNRTIGLALTFKYDAVDLFLRLRKKKLDSGAQ